MTAQFTQRSLYGGAIVAELPADFLDASDLRQIPDHQEVYLSPRTLTSAIIELNDYQSPSAAEVHSNIRASRRQSDPISQDESASTHHFIDPIPAEDHLDPGSLTLHPPRVALAQSSVANLPAYTQTGVILGPEVNRVTRATTTVETKVFQLLVRMAEHETDLCVRVNVPLKEFEGKAEAKDEEIKFAESIIARFISSLDVKDFGLFRAA